MPIKLIWLTLPSLVLLCPGPERLAGPVPRPWRVRGGDQQEREGDHGAVEGQRYGQGDGGGHPQQVEQLADGRPEQVSAAILLDLLLLLLLRRWRRRVVFGRRSRWREVLKIYQDLWEIARLVNKKGCATLFLYLRSEREKKWAVKGNEKGRARA